MATGFYFPWAKGLFRSVALGGLKPNWAAVVNVSDLAT